MALTSVDGVQRRFDEFEDAVHDLLKTKAEQAGKIFKKPSKKTIQAICVKHGIAIKPAETTTDARLMAVRDICNFITFAAMNYAFVVTMKIHPALIVNIDATQFKVGSDSSGAVFVVVSEEDEELLAISGKPLKAAPRKGDNSHGVSFFIKYYLLMTAAGNIMDPVFVIQDPFMEAETMDPYWVPGLGVTPHVMSGGWVVFCQTRGCNKAFYRWLYMDYFTKAIWDLRKAYELPEDATAWFQLDGEPLQIDLFKEEAIVDHFCQLCVVCWKPPASTTECTQACDCGNCFKGSKCALRGIKDKDIDEDLAAHLITRLKDKVFAVHMAKTRTGEPEPPPEPPESSTKPQGKSKPAQLSYEHRKMAIMGLLRIQKAVSGSVKQSTVQESWKKCGIYPFNLDTILGNCKKTVTAAERDCIRQGLPQLAERILEQGELLAADMRAALGPDIHLPHLASRDLLVLYRRRS
ncbi:hypothetical protein B484DRAFT_398301, partial [Ochromonadaceae sp. CCMP2298]